MSGCEYLPQILTSPIFHGHHHLQIFGCNVYISPHLGADLVLVHVVYRPIELNGQMINKMDK